MVYNKKTESSEIVQIQNRTKTGESKTKPKTDLFRTITLNKSYKMNVIYNRVRRTRIVRVRQSSDSTTLKL